jgi:hypothetical protein
VNQGTTAGCWVSLDDAVVTLLGKHSMDADFLECMRLIGLDRV